MAGERCERPGLPGLCLDCRIEERASYPNIADSRSFTYDQHCPCPCGCDYPSDSTCGDCAAGMHVK